MGLSWTVQLQIIDVLSAPVRLQTSKVSTSWTQAGAFVDNFNFNLDRLRLVRVGCCHQANILPGHRTH